LALASIGKWVMVVTRGPSGEALAAFVIVAPLQSCKNTKSQRSSRTAMNAMLSKMGCTSVGD
jgi:hypothetical protein